MSKLHTDDGVEITPDMAVYIPGSDKAGEVEGRYRGAVLVNDGRDWPTDRNHTIYDCDGGYMASIRPPFTLYADRENAKKAGGDA